MSQEPDERPYPLLRRFLRVVLPGSVMLALVTALIAGFGARQLAEELYLEQAVRRAQVIDRAMVASAPAAWARLKRGDLPALVYAETDGGLLRRALADEVRELDLAHLKIYATSGRIQFSTDPDQIGTVDRSPAFVAATERSERSAVLKTLPDGSALYELYVPLVGDDPHPVVIELYEPVGHLKGLLWQVGMVAAAIPSLLLVALMLVTGRLVARAQRDMDGRAALVTALRSRLERLVSGAASEAVRHAVRAGETIPSTRTRCTILFADIRDFTAFAEANPPEHVVGFLNVALSIVVEAIAREAGDVDKMIGDAVLARFQGRDAEARAITAARDALRRLALADLPRGAGIGIVSGEVISGTIGPADRMDFTVIGDTVNLAARLCSAAGRGELVVDEATVEAACDAAFGMPESLSVKGRRGSLIVRRWSSEQPQAPEARVARTADHEMVVQREADRLDGALDLARHGDVGL